MIPPVVARSVPYLCQNNVSTDGTQEGLETGAATQTGSITEQHRTDPAEDNQSAAASDQDRRRKDLNLIVSNSHKLSTAIE